MVLTLILSIIIFVAITLSILLFPNIKIKNVNIPTYPIIAVIGALLLIILQLAPIKLVGEEMIKDAGINPLKILVLFFSMTFISICLDEAGLFKILANKAIKVAGKKQIKIFVAFYLLTSILTIFTSNDIVILTFTPFICLFAKNAKINPIPYLVAEFAAANTWSMMLIIGNPTNIYLATSANITFLEYIKIMFLPTLISGILEFLLIMLIFNKQLKKEIEPVYEEFKPESKLDIIVGLIHLIICIIFLVISSYIKVEMYLIALASAFSLLLYIIVSRLIRKRSLKVTLTIGKKLPWQLIPFVLSMFTIVVALNYQGVSAKLSELLAGNHPIIKYGLSSFVTSNFINNIPMSILYSNLPLNLSGISFNEAIYASIIGSNIGAFLTPLGALAGIMFTNLTKDYSVKYGFKEFIKYGLIISIPVILVAELVLSFVI